VSVSSLIDSWVALSEGVPGSVGLGTHDNYEDIDTKRGSAEKTVTIPDFRVVL